MRVIGPGAVGLAPGPQYLGTSMVGDGGSPGASWQADERRREFRLLGFDEFPPPAWPAHVRTSGSQSRSTGGARNAQPLDHQLIHLNDIEGEITMLVRFSSTKTESITMFGDVAVRLIELMGASGAIPGAIRPEQIPAAVQRLRNHLKTNAQPPSEHPEAVRDQDEDKSREPQVALATRAAPLIDLLERAAAANVPVMWEAG